MNSRKEYQRQYRLNNIYHIRELKREWYRRTQKRKRPKHYKKRNADVALANQAQD